MYRNKKKHVIHGFHAARVAAGAGRHQNQRHGRCHLQLQVATLLAALLGTTGTT